VFVLKTSSTLVATWFWQTEGRSAEHVFLGVRSSEFILLEFQSPSGRIFIGSHSLPPLWSPIRSFINVNDESNVWHSRLCHINFGCKMRLAKLSLIPEFTLAKG
jgi:hypothetical protein